MNIGIVAGIIMGLSYAPYIVSILKGHTKPERGARLIWASLAIVALYAQYSAGGESSLWYAASLTLFNFLVFLLSITHGLYGLTASDLRAYAMVIAAVVISVLFQSPLLSLLMVIFIHATGGYLTVRKAAAKPYSENMTSFILGTIGAALALVSVGELNFTLLIYPLYAVLLNLTITATLVKNRHLSPVKA